MICLVFYPFFAPTDHIRNTFYRFVLIFLNTGSAFKELVTFCLDDSGQRLNVGDLRVAVVHHFIQQLVDHPKIIPDTFLFNFEEVIRHD